jgi:hypothetical protein
VTQLGGYKRCFRVRAERARASVLASARARSVPYGDDNLRNKRPISQKQCMHNHRAHRATDARGRTQICPLKHGPCWTVAERSATHAHGRHSADHSTSSACSQPEHTETSHTTHMSSGRTVQTAGQEGWALGGEQVALAAAGCTHSPRAARRGKKVREPSTWRTNSCVKNRFVRRKEPDHMPSRPRRWPLQMPSLR